MTVYAGKHTVEPIEQPAVYRSVTEIDPRVRLWKRCKAAICVGGFESPTPPYPPVLTVSTAFISENSADGVEMNEARLNILIKDGVAGVVIQRAGSSGTERHEVTIQDVEDIKALARAVFDTLARAEARPRSAP
ncbi:hypothetical protein BTHE68_39950 [Burkholderia sp. THE68]|nr:hypothetical protein BTHE68_39950 [Burkholderia sp. THE68]